MIALVCVCIYLVGATTISAVGAFASGYFGGEEALKVKFGIGDAWPPVIGLALGWPLALLIWVLIKAATLFVKLIALPWKGAERLGEIVAKRKLERATVSVKLPKGPYRDAPRCSGCGSVIALPPKAEAAP
jgi:hypothetical protein